MVIKVYGIPSGSTCTQRVTMTLHEKGIPYKFIAVNFAAGENKSKEFLAMSPFGKVPVYVGDDGMVLFESRAICRYIALKWRDEGTRLIPDNWDLAGRTEDGEGIGGWARFENACSMETSYFDHPTMTIGIERVYKSFYGLPCDESKVQENVVLLEKVLNVYDKILADNKYFCGNDFSLADLFHIPNAIFVRRLKGFQEIFGRYPNFSRWLKLCEQREAWGKALEDTKGMERKE